MYKINRVGPWPVVDIDSAAFWPTEWNVNFDLPDGFVGNIRPAVQSAILKENADTVSWVSKAKVSLSGGNNMCFTVAVGGQEFLTPDIPNFWEVMVSADFFHSSADDLGLSVLVGRSPTASLSDDHGNNINTWDDYQCLPAPKVYASHSCHVSYQGQLVNIDAASDGHGSNPVMLGVLLQNHGNAADVECFVTQSLRRYSGDVAAYDPQR